MEMMLMAPVGPMPTNQVDLNNNIPTMAMEMPPVGGGMPGYPPVMDMQQNMNANPYAQINANPYA